MKTFEIDLDDSPERWQLLYDEVERAILEGEVEGQAKSGTLTESMIWPYWSCA